MGLFKSKKEKLTALLRGRYTADLPRFYCQLNCHEIPEGFPMALTPRDTNRETHEDPEFRMAFDCVREILGEEGCSKAWWTIALKRTEEEWEVWWKREGHEIQKQISAITKQKNFHKLLPGIGRFFLS